jgi:conjugal transfer pilus assembly protein TraW
MVMGAEPIDLGTFGPVFSVEEENMIVALKRKLQLLDEAGKLDALKEQWRQKIQESFKRPKAVDGITTTITERSFHHDPTLIIEHDIQTPKGDYLSRKGDTLNPLLVMKPEKGFLFINGDLEEHIDFAKNHLEKYDVVLVAGSPIDAESQLKVPVFFDQGGYLTTHYGIKQVPALLSVDHNLLLIREVKP